MDQLNEKQRETIMKMNSEVLIKKLKDRGFSDDQVKVMSKSEMNEKYAQILVKDTENVAVSVDIKNDGFEREMEVRRFEFEKEKFRMQFEADQRNRETEKEKFKMQFEADQRLKEIELENENRLKREQFQSQMEQQRQYNEDFLRIQEAKLKFDSEMRTSKVMQMKYFGDALRNCIPRQPYDAVELNQYLEIVESIFNDIECPEEFRVQLLRPHLNEKTKLLLNRMSSGDALDYNKVKQFLRNEYHLSAKVYLDRFNTMVKSQDETYVVYANRLKSTYDSYLSACKITTKEQLISNIVAQRMKQTVPGRPLDHVLTVESAIDGMMKWMEHDKLAVVLDDYVTAHSEGSKKYEATNGSVGKFSWHNRNNVKQLDEPRKMTGVINNRSSPLANQPSTSSQPRMDEIPQGRPQRHCYICNSTLHLRRDCPDLNTMGNTRVAGQNSKTHENSTSKPETSTRVNACLIEPCVKRLYETPELSFSDELPQENALIIIDEVHTGDKPVENLLEQLSHLEYATVQIEGIVGNYDALVDSGAEISIVRSDVVENLSLNYIGKVLIRGLFGPGVTCNVSMIRFRLLEGDEVDNHDYIDILCAICDSANDQLLLSSDSLSKLWRNSTKNNCVNESLHFSDELVGYSNGANNNSDGHPCINTKALEHSTSGVDFAYKDSECGGVELLENVPGASRVNFCSGLNSHLKQNAEKFDDVDRSTDMEVIENGEETSSIRSSCERKNESTGCVHNVSVDTSNISRILSAGVASADILMKEQQLCPTLVNCWHLAEQHKGGYYVEKGLLYHREEFFGTKISQLVIPQAGGRREMILRQGHDQYGAHLG